MGLISQGKKSISAAVGHGGVFSQSMKLFMNRLEFITK